MTERKTSKWKIILGYASFATAAFVFFFYVTFPYEALRQRIKAEAGAAGWDVEIGDMGPGFFGISADNLELKKKQAPGAAEGDAPEVGFLVDSLSLRPSVFPLGVAFKADVMGGTARGAVGGMSALSVDVELDEVNLAEGNLKAFSGLDMTGLLNGRLKLTAPITASGNGPKEPDFGQANGELVLEGQQVVVNGGTLTVPMYGTPTPMDLPKIPFGNIDGLLKIEKGAGRLETLTAKSEELDLAGSGTLKLAKRLEYSEPNLELKFKVEQEFVKRLGMLGAGLGMLKSDPKDPQFKMVTMTGFIGRPSFR